MTKTRATLNFDAFSAQLEALPRAALQDIADAVSAKLIKLPLDLFLCERVPASSARDPDVIVYTCRLDGNFDLAAAAKRALEAEHCSHDETTLNMSKNIVGDSYE